MKKNITTLMVTHNLKHAVTYGDRTIMMHEGKIVLDVKSEEKNKKVLMITYTYLTR